METIISKEITTVIWRAPKPLITILDAIADDQDSSRNRLLTLIVRKALEEEVVELGSHLEAYQDYLRSVPELKSLSELKASLAPKKPPQEAVRNGKKTPKRSRTEIGQTARVSPKIFGAA